jgi:hypothetical protein
VKEKLQSPSLVLSAIQERLAASMAQPVEALDGVVEALFRGRGYSWIGIYLAAANLGAYQALSGPAPAGVTMADLPGETAVPIKHGARTLGLIVARTARRGISSRRDHALLEQVAKSIARYAATDRVQRLLRAKFTTQEKLPAERETTQQKTSHPQKGPQSVRPVMRKAAAGGRTLR